MNYKKKLQEKIEKSKKLVADFKEHGIIVEMDEKTGEITVPMSEFNKPEVQEWLQRGDK